MPRTPKILTTRPDQVHPTQARLAFLTDNGQARPALLHALDGDRVELRNLAGATAAVVVVHHPDRLAAVLERDDLCRLHDEPLVFVNTQYRVLAVATGPATPPANVEMLIVCELDDEGGVVELLSAGEGQPAWQTFALVDVLRDR